MASPARLHWQSKLVLLLVLPAAGVWLAVLLLRLAGAGAAGAAGTSAAGAPGLAAGAAGIAAGAALALLVWRAHAATPGGALTGGLLMACFSLTTPGWRSSVWPLLTMLALTLAATRVGRARKQHLGTAESSHGRGAAQVAANLGAAALAGALIDSQGQVVALTVLLACLCEAAADTLASELGQALAGTPRLITTLRAVPPGTDGGITLAGTALGAAGAAIIAAVGVLTMNTARTVGVIAAAAGIAGLLFDSLLGATLERAGRLNNDAVNFLSTVFAALVALAASQVIR